MMQFQSFGFPTGGPFNPNQQPGTVGPQTPLFGPNAGQPFNPNLPPGQPNALGGGFSALGTTVSSAVTPKLPDWLTKFGQNITNPAFWKLTAVVGVAIILIGAGVVLMAFGEIGGIENRAVRA